MTEADYLIQNLPKEEKKEEKIEGKDQSLNDLDPNRLRVAQNEDGKIKSTKDQDLLNSQVKTAFAMQPSKNQTEDLQYWKERFGSDNEEDEEEKVKIKI